MPHQNKDANGDERRQMLGRMQHDVSRIRVLHLDDDVGGTPQVSTRRVRSHRRRGRSLWRLRRALERPAQDGAQRATSEEGDRIWTKSTVIPRVGLR